MFHIGASYDFERNTNITPKPSLRHRCVPEKVGVNKQTGTTEEIFLSDKGVVESSRRKSLRHKFHHVHPLNVLLPQHRD